MKKLCMIGLAAMLCAPSAFAAGMPKGQIAGHLTMMDVGFDDGIGFGVRGWGSINGPIFLHGEYTTVSLDFADIDVLRLGGGMVGDMQKGLMWLGKAEYIAFGQDADEAGFGFHGGLMFSATPELGLFGTLGYLITDNTDGLELNFGASYAFSRELSGIVDYRTYMGSVDPAGDFDVDELRFAVAYNFY